MDNNKLKKLIITVGVILILGISGTAAYIGLDLGAPKDNNANDDSIMTTAVVTLGDIEKSISGSGNIEATDIKSVPMPVDGQIGNVVVSSGQYVSEDDVLVELDAQVLEEKLKEKEEELYNKMSELSSTSAGTKTIYIRAPFDGEISVEHIYKDGDIDEIINEHGSLLTLVGEDETIDIGENVPSGTIKYAYADKGEDFDEGDKLFGVRVEKPNFQKLYDEVETLNKEIDLIKYYIDDPYIKAPVDGIVMGELDLIGKDFDKDSTVLELAIKSNYSVTITVDATELLENIYQGQMAKVRFENSTELDATVTHINNIAADNKGQYEVTITINESTDNILIGQSADVAVMVENVENVLTVPIEAVYQDSQGDYVMLYTGEGSINQYEDSEIPTQKAYIERGMVSEQYVEVVSGVNKGDTVLITLTSNQQTGSKSYMGGMSTARIIGGLKGK